jgi:magnesium transporter
MPYVSFYLNPSGELQKELKEEEIRAAFASGEGLLWVDIGETSQEDGEFLERVFHFHPLAIEDCVETAINNPKVDEYDDYLFMVFHGINYTVETNILQTTEFDLFLGPHLLVTNHNHFLHSVAAIKRLVEVDGRLMRRGVDFLAHALIDALVNNITPAVDQLVERADAIEDIIFRSHHPSTLEAILHIKRSSLRLRRAMVPQREVLNRLSRHEFISISDEAAIYYRDIYDDVARIEGFIDNLRDRTDTILSTYMSVVANQQNETMKTLSLVAAVFLPLTLLAGIYGMNFEFMPELQFRYGYFIVLGVMIAVAGGVVWWFWARRWIMAGRRRLEKFVPAAVDPERLISYVGHVARWPHL